MKVTLRLLLLTIIIHQLSMINCSAQWVTHSPATVPARTVNCLATSGNNIFAGTASGVYLSSDTGHTWTQVNNGLTDTAVFALTVNGSNIYAGVNGGAYLSTNNGGSWTALNNGLSRTSKVVYSMASNATYIFAGIEGGGVYRFSVDTGTTWVAANTGLATTFPTSLAASGNNVYIASQYGGVYVSYNNADSWARTAGIGLGADTIINALALSGTQIYIGTDFQGAMVSSDSGGHFTGINDGFPLGVFNDFNVFSFVVNGSQLFAGTQSSGIYLSTNNGATWASVGAGIPVCYVNSLVILDSVVFAGTSIAGVWQQGLSGASNPSSVLTVSQGVTSPDCLGGSTGSISDTVTGGVLPYRLYATADGVHYFYDNHFTSVGTLLNLTPGTYTVTIADTENHAITIIAEIYEPNQLTVSVSLSTDTLCPGQSATGVATASGGTPPYQYLWTVEGVNLIYGDSVDSLHVGVFNVIVVDHNTCDAAVNDTIHACTTGNTCSAFFMLYPDTLIPHHWYALNQATGTGPISYVWNWGDGSPTDTGATPSHIYADSGYYNICLTITDSTGCTSSHCSTPIFLRSTESLMITVNVVTQLPISTGIVSASGLIITTSIYPNPATNQLLIKATNYQPNWLTIYDMDGRVVTGQRFTPQVDISTLAPGIYFIELSNENVTERKRFVKL